MHVESTHLNVSACTYECECLYVWGVYLWRPKIDSYVFLNCSPHYILRQALSVEPRTHQLTCLARQLALGIRSLFLRHWNCRWPLYPPGFHLGAGDPKIGSSHLSNKCFGEPSSKHHTFLKIVVKYI